MAGGSRHPIHIEQPVGGPRRLNYRRLKNMMAILLAAVYFADSWLGKFLRQDIGVRNITWVWQRFVGVVEFHSYGLVDGIATLLADTECGTGVPPRRLPMPCNLSCACSHRDKTGDRPI